MLKQRVITALLLLAVLLPALFYHLIAPFAILSLLLIAAAGWEWARLNGCRVGLSALLGVGMGSALLLFWWAGGLAHSWRGLWVALAAVWASLVVVMLARGVAGWRVWPAALRLWGGLLLLACAWLALVQARQIGLEFLLSVLTLVWMADIAAYVGGKALGRHKLAPAVSPGKTWEGAISGAIGVLVLAGIWVLADAQGWGGQGSLYAHLWSLGPLLALIGLAFLTTMGVLGDLVESLVKRSAGAKDSSRLLPGHGGVLDRIDSLLPVLPLSMIFVTFMP